MSEWICATIKPPTCLSVALYVIEFHEPNLKNICDDKIYTGFWDESKKNWFLDEPNHIYPDNYFSEIENEITKVVCWTLLQQKPVFSEKLVMFLHKS